MTVPSRAWRGIAAFTAVVLLVVGLWALNLQAQQARDTTRKLDLADLESALLRVLAQTGTVPPADQPTWCGVISAPTSQTVKDDMERALRATKKYAKAEKPFPKDPRAGGTDRDYVYWKTSPVSFELLAFLEADDNNSRPFAVATCTLRHALDQGSRDTYDYAISSTQRTPL